MKKLKRLYESKRARARRLPVGTWFVYPDVLPRRYKYYQPRIYRARADGEVSPAMYEDLGFWEHTGGVNSPQAAHDRLDEIARTLNAMRADEAAATTFLDRLTRRRVQGATESLSQLLLQTAQPRKEDIMTQVYVMTAQKLFDELMALRDERRDWADLEIYVEVVDRASYEREAILLISENTEIEYESQIIGEGSVYAFQVHTPYDRNMKQGDDYILLAAVEFEDDTGGEA